MDILPDGDQVSESLINVITSLPTIDTLLPHTFPNGSHVDSLSVSCIECGSNIPHENIHGKLEIRNKHTAQLQAHLLCYHCQVVAYYEARLHDDGTVLIRTEGGWTEERYSPQRPVTLQDHFLKLIETAKKLF